MIILYYSFGSISWELIFQGFFLSLMLSIGIYILFSDHVNFFKSTNRKESGLGKFIQEFIRFITLFLNNLTIENFIKSNKTEDSKKRIYNGKYLTIVFIFIISVFTLGIIGNSIADKWIDSKNIYHLGLKSLWVNKSEMNLNINLNDSIYSFNKTDDIIKVKSFDEVFKNIAQISNNQKRQFYFSIKHELYENSNWSEMIQDLQRVINFTQIFSLGFFVLLLFSIINYLLVSIRLALFNWNKQFKIKALISISFIIILIVFIWCSLQSNRIHFLILFVPLIVYLYATLSKLPYFKVTTSLLIVYISILGYFTSSYAWKLSEYEISKQVFGVYKYLNKDIRKEDRKSINEFYYDSNNLKINQK
jgi:hypothetical protein